MKFWLATIIIADDGIGDDGPGDYFTQQELTDDILSQIPTAGLNTKIVNLVECEGKQVLVSHDIVTGEPEDENAKNDTLGGT